MPRKLPECVLTQEAREARQPGPGAWVDKCLRLVTLTPIAGGGSTKQELGPSAEPIRASSIRGQMRAWWRARHGRVYTNSRDLFEGERKLWGGPGADAKSVYPAGVRVAVSVEPKSVREDREDVSWRHPDFYVLWPLGMQGQFPRWHAGLEFDLTLQYRETDEAAVKEAVLDWILFGGVGGRTRRGCGAVGVRDAVDREWLGLPAKADTLAGAGPGGGNGQTVQHVPTLASASLVAGAPVAQTKSLDA